MTKAMSVFTKAMALMQENTPESKVAILELLSQLNLSDEKTLSEVKLYIKNLIDEHLKQFKDVMSSLDKISAENKKIMEGSNEEEKLLDGDSSETDVGDGTSI